MEQWGSAGRQLDLNLKLQHKKKKECRAAKFLIFGLFTPPTVSHDMQRYSITNISSAQPNTTPILNEGSRECLQYTIYKKIHSDVRECSCVVRVPH